MSSSLSRQKLFPLTPNTSHSLKNFFPCVLRPRSWSKHWVSVLIFSLFMHSCILDLGYGVFQNIWGFWVFPKIFWLGFVKLSLYAHALHSHCILQCFMHLDVCLIIGMCARRFGLGFTHDAIYIFARHMFMHISCIRIPFLSLILVVMCFYLSSLSLSLSLE